MKLETEIIINTSSDIVWNHLMNFEQYPNWNPFIKFIQGNAVKGNSLVVKIHPPDSSVMTFKPLILKSEKNVEFRWLGHFGIPGLFDGEHSFTLFDQGNNTTLFKHEERFSGILVPLFKKTLKTKTQVGFERMNHALKKLCE